MSQFLLLTPDKFSQINRRYIGDKAAEIAQLYKLNLPIPETILLPSKILKDILFFNKLADKFLEQLDNTDWENPLSIAASSKLLQKYIKTLSYPEVLTKQLIAIYHQKFKAGFVAVRLSPLSETEAPLKNAYLNVKGDANLLHSITHIWADHFSENLLKKRYQEIKSGQFAATTILLQKMIASDSAGIAFTKDVKTLGKNLIHIYSSWGIADNIEQLQNLDKFFVHFSNQNIILRDIALKTISYERKLDAQKIKKVKTKNQALPSLSDQQILQIANYTAIAKRKQIDHVALEWASEKNQIYILGFSKNYPHPKKKTATTITKSANLKTHIKVIAKESAVSFDYQAIELLSNPNLLAKQIAKFSEFKHKKTPIILPFVRTVHEYLLLKQKLTGFFILLEIASPAALLEIADYLKHSPHGFSLNLNNIDLCLKGINNQNKEINDLYSFDTHLMKQLLDRFFEKVHTFEGDLHIQVQLKQLDFSFLSYLSEKKITSVLVRENQSEHCRVQLFEIEKAKF